MRMLDIVYRWLIPALWIAWAAYWTAAASGTKTTRRTESPAQGVAHWTPLVLGIVLLSLPHRAWMGWLGRLILPRTELMFWSAVALVAAGLGFAVWARRHLGSNWSGVVTLKDDHALIRSGPYGLVRHPIYTGALLAVVGSAMALDEWRGVVGLALVAASFRRKIALEERWLAEQFPADYADYCRDVPALVPRFTPR
jgi:protein-S-isoprenylcysteine O-methyltransferase Ste14